MRVSTNQLYTNHQRSISKRQAEFSTAQMQVSTGKRITQLSDDPSATPYLIQSRSVRSAVERYQKNLTSGKDFLANSESSLNEVAKIMTQGYQLALQGATSATEQTSRDAIATTVNTLQERLVSLANTRGNRGQFIFGGQTNEAGPFSVSSGTLTFNGDTNPIQIETAPGTRMTVSTDTSATFIEAYDALEALKNDLRGGNIGNLSGLDVPRLQTSFETMNALRGDVGARLQRVGELETENQRRMDELTTTISEIEDVDIVEAVSRMQQTQVAYQAALQASSVSFNLSLMDFMR